MARDGFFVFFFSSRRRHTRYIGDWSSDVCSSDLFVLCLLVLPVCYTGFAGTLEDATSVPAAVWVALLFLLDRKSTRLNSSHRCISYAVFCLKKKRRLKVLTQ